MAKNLQVALLKDFYGKILTEKQLSFLDYYYDDDLSLAEIAENEGITRQGVRDAIKRAEFQLFEAEEKLGLVRRFDEIKAGLREIGDCAVRISEQNMKCAISKEISDLTVKIRSIVNELSE
ncbi:MAG: DNA-binding protein [Clostridia bacterium]|nr:DNA-binding protein [Clostridia bacterium]